MKFYNYNLQFVIKYNGECKTKGTIKKSVKRLKSITKI